MIFNKIWANLTQFYWLWPCWLLLAYTSCHNKPNKLNKCTKWRWNGITSNISIQDNSKTSRKKLTDLRSSRIMCKWSRNTTMIQPKLIRWEWIILETLPMNNLPKKSWTLNLKTWRETWTWKLLEANQIWDHLQLQ